MVSQEKMIEALRMRGIDVVPVMKALVPMNIGTPIQIDGIIEEMHIEDAYQIYCCNVMRNYDPFAEEGKRFGNYVLTKKGDM